MDSHTVHCILKVIGQKGGDVLKSIQPLTIIIGIAVSDCCYLKMHVSWSSTKQGSEKSNMVLASIAHVLVHATIAGPGLRSLLRQKS